MKELEYLLTCIAEEAAEIIQAASKCARFGMDDYWEPRGKTNKEYLIQEINDLMGVIDLMKDRGVLPEDLVHRINIEAKKEKVKKWMDYAREKGILDTSCDLCDDYGWRSDTAEYCTCSAGVRENQHDREKVGSHD